MAVAGLIDAIGIASAGLTTIGFAQSNWATHEAQGATVRIKAGLPLFENQADSLEGSINKIYAFDTRNGYAGQADGGHIDDGGILDVTVDQSTPGLRAEYVGISNNNDATCIAWITIEQFDGTRGGAWTGDVGASCGQSYHYSDEAAGKLKNPDGSDSTEDYLPQCTWLDGDHTNDIEAAALKFNVDAFGEDQVDVTLSGDPCASTIYGPDNGPINDNPAKRAAGNSTRTPIHLRERPTSMKQYLIVSNRASQPAKDLCENPRSWGPDFVGYDGFCDMATKTLSPLCSTADVDGCVDVDETGAEGGAKIKRRTTVARRSVNSVHKSYKTVAKWGGAKQ